MMWRYWNWNGGYGGTSLRLGMLLAMILWWSLVISALVLFVRWLIRQERSVRGGTGGPPGTGTEEDPLAIAKRRYARGEISREQYEELKETLLR